MAQEALRRDEALALLRSHKKELAERFDVASVYLFGSTARDRATATSDVDILVDFNGPATIKRIFDLQSYIEGLVDRPVDLVTRKALKKEIRPYIEAEAIDVSEEKPANARFGVTAKGVALPLGEYDWILRGRAQNY